MEINIRDICEIHGFRVTQYKRLNGDNVVNNFTNIRNADGQVVSKDFNDPHEAIKLLLDIEESVNTQ